MGLRRNGLAFGGTYAMGGVASYLEQMRKGAEFMTKLHKSAIECGAEWDGQDGYRFSTEEQHKRYTARIKEVIDGDDKQS